MDKQELEQKSEELKKQLDELKNVKIDGTKTKWIPSRMEVFYFINNDLDVIENVCAKTDFEKPLIEIGNCFKTEEEAQFIVDKIKYTLMFKHYVEEHSEPLDWENEFQWKWSIFYNYVIHKIELDYAKRFKEQGTIYASSEEILQDAIEYVGEDNVKKYILEVED